MLIHSLKQKFVLVLKSMTLQVELLDFIYLAFKICEFLPVLTYLSLRKQQPAICKAMAL